jgi:hypothetical protein
MVSPNQEFVAVMQQSFAADAPLLLGCQAGVRSLSAAQVLAAAGFTNLANVLGGFGGGSDPRSGVFSEGWIQAGLPIGRGTSDGETYQSIRDRAAGTSQPG